MKFVNIPVAQQDEALRFYTEKLGFTVMTDHEHLAKILAAALLESVAGSVRRWDPEQLEKWPPSPVADRASLRSEPAADA